ncbi:MAG: PDZ domain-containing protein [Bacteroidota bacterium]|jgi:tricorn protease
MNKSATLIFLLFFNQTIFAQESRLLRFPTTHNDRVVFSYAGDLYAVNKAGGQAVRLTSHPGYEMFARFSPDGKSIAFTAQYDGNTEVYLMPSGGGEPKRLTYTATLSRDDLSDRMGPNNIVMTWRDDNSIVYRSRKQTFNDFKGQLFIANTGGGISEELPLPCGGFCSFSADKSKMAYNRIFREFRTWKYYEGGMADDIWIYDFNSKQTINITNNNAQDIQPMWFGERIYFLSDRDRTMNLFCYDINSKQIRKVTDYNDYDIKFPSAGSNAIVFERGGYIYIMDVLTEVITKLDITISGDNQFSRSLFVDGSKNIESVSIGADGSRVVAVGRGDVVTIPAENGITRNLSQTSGAHERNAVWSPDGKYIAYISDLSGEDEIYIHIPDGQSKPQQITSASDVYMYELSWSPDSKKIMWGDKKHRLQYVDINSKTIKTIDRSDWAEFRDYSWSPDSKWVAYTKQISYNKDNIYLFNLSSQQKIEATDGWFDSYNPVFSSDGKYLFFVSLRDYNPTFSNTDFQISYSDMARPYLIVLSKSTANPFAPVNDDVKVKTEVEPATNKEEPKKTTDKTDSSVKDILIDADNIVSRTMMIDVDAGNYSNIESLGDKLYYMFTKSGEKRRMMMYDLKLKKQTELGEAAYFELSADRKKVLVKKGESYYVIDVPTSKLDLTKSVDLSNMKWVVNKKEEWAQIYNESWRQMRDFFYAPNMHGVDWNTMKSKYGTLLPYVNHRMDLTYLIGELIGELNVGHAYTGGGDVPKVERIKLGLLGAKLVRDASGFFRINSILDGANYSKELRSPLTEIGVQAKSGEFIVAVNGRPTNTVTDIYELLMNTADKQVELAINTTATLNGARKVIVVPLTDESKLYYYNWVQRNIKYVDSVSGGRIGYLHVPNMGVEGLNEFMKYFYPQMSKKALIIDDRGNGGGFVSPLITERLNQKLVYYEFMRNALGKPDPDGHYGPKALLLDHYSASDGDIFPYRFKKYQLGKTIGTRSWGGVVGIRGTLPFIDGGILNRPEFAPYLADGFVIEGYGVDPDIVIENDPAREYAGIDDQLNKAIEVLLDELKTKEQTTPPIPPYPNKSK